MVTPGSDPSIIVVGALSDNDGKCGALGGSLKIIVDNKTFNLLDNDKKL
jgi:hypothetical protein